MQDIMRTDTGVDGDAQRISQITWMLFLKIEELFATCDQFEAALTKAQHRQTGLMASILHHVSSL